MSFLEFLYDSRLTLSSFSTSIWELTENIEIVTVRFPVISLFKNFLVVKVIVNLYCHLDQGRRGCSGVSCV